MGVSQNTESSYNDVFTVESVANLREKEVCIEGQALREAPHVSHKVANFDPSTEVPLLTVPSDASTRDAEKAWVPSISVGVKIGVEHVEHGKPSDEHHRLNKKKHQDLLREARMCEEHPCEGSSQR